MNLECAIYKSHPFIAICKSQMCHWKCKPKKLVTVSSYSIKGFAGKTAGRSFLFSSMADDLARRPSSAVSKAISEALNADLNKENRPLVTNGPSFIFDLKSSISDLPNNCAFWSCFRFADLKWLFVFFCIYCHIIRSNRNVIFSIIPLSLIHVLFSLNISPKTWLFACRVAIVKTEKRNSV